MGNYSLVRIDLELKALGVLVASARVWQGRRDEDARSLHYDQERRWSALGIDTGAPFSPQFLLPGPNVCQDCHWSSTAPSLQCTCMQMDGTWDLVSQDARRRVNAELIHT